MGSGAGAHNSFFVCAQSIRKSSLLIFLMYILFLTTPRDLQDVSSLTRD